MFSCSEPVTNPPSEFTSPPLLEGLLTSLTQVLGPHVKPTPIQVLSLKHLFASDSSSTSPTSSLQWKQCLLASETDLVKSIAYCLSILQDLKLAELRHSQKVDDVSQAALWVLQGPSTIPTSTIGVPPVLPTVNLFPAARTPVAAK